MLSTAIHLYRKRRGDKYITKHTLLCIYYIKLVNNRNYLILGFMILATGIQGIGVHIGNLASCQDTFFGLFDLILYVPSTIFQLYRDGSSWVEPVLS